MMLSSLIRSALLPWTLEGKAERKVESVQLE
jgi:hypothetical protein